MSPGGKRYVLRTTTWALVAILAACGQRAPPSTVPGTISVTANTVQAREVPFDAEFVAQTRSIGVVEIRARAAGVLEKKLYKEGELVRAGQAMFQMDRRPLRPRACSS